MRLPPLTAILLLLFNVDPAASQSADFFHEKIGVVATHFASLNIPDLEKIQLPQAQPDGSFVFIYVWLPKTHRPTQASFEANIGDYFDIIGAEGNAFDGWCYLRKPESHVLKTATSEVAVMRIRALGYRGAAPRRRCHGGLPGAAGRLGQTHVIKDPRSGLLSMVRSGHPTRFPSVEDKVQ